MQSTAASLHLDKFCFSLFVAPAPVSDSLLSPECIVAPEQYKGIVSVVLDAFASLRFYSLLCVCLCVFVCVCCWFHLYSRWSNPEESVP